MSLLGSVGAVATAFFATCGLPLLAIVLAVVIWSWIHASSSRGCSVARGPADTAEEPEVPAPVPRLTLEWGPRGGR